MTREEKNQLKNKAWPLFFTNCPGIRKIRNCQLLGKCVTLDFHHWSGYNVYKLLKTETLKRNIHWTCFSTVFSFYVNLPVRSVGSTYCYYLPKLFQTSWCSVSFSDFSKNNNNKKIAARATEMYQPLRASCLYVMISNFVFLWDFWRYI